MAAESDMCAFHTVQTAVDALSGRDDVPDGVYLSACEAMKELHSITDLYLVKYDRFYACEDGEDAHGGARLAVERETSCQAILRKDTKTHRAYGRMPCVSRFSMNSGAWYRGILRGDWGHTGA